MTIAEGVYTTSKLTDFVRFYFFSHYTWWIPTGYQGEKEKQMWDRMKCPANSFLSV
jgi:hypothetical protein